MCENPKVDFLTITILFLHIICSESKNGNLNKQSRREMQVSPRDSKTEKKKKKL